MFKVLDKITELREERGWSVYRIAKEADIPQSTIATWYSQHRTPPIEDIEKICDAFDITLQDFFADSPVISSETPLARKRKESDLSQEELAKKAKISVETVCSYEQGKRDITKAQYRIVKALADALSCRMEEIVEG